MSNDTYDDEAQYVFYHGHDPCIQIKGDYVYAFNQAGDIRCMSMVSVVRMILDQGNKIE